jgi:carnitine O-acetyltransferase
MGLKILLRGDETHQLFEDECYAKSQEWKLSTSGLSSGASLTGSGFGAAWPDGYGINCTSRESPSGIKIDGTDLAGPYLLKFGIESKWSCEVTSTACFKHHLAQSFRDMRRVVEASAHEEKAKL